MMKAWISVSAADGERVGRRRAKEVEKRCFGDVVYVWLERECGVHIES